MNIGSHVASASDFGLIVKRNCSISPRDLSWLLVSIALLTCGIGLAFAWLGAWPILPFAGLETVALGAAFFLNGRHAADYERIAMRAGRVVVEMREADRVSRHEFGANRVRVREHVRGREYRVTLLARDEEIEIGRHWDAERRQGLARTLRRELSNC